MNQMQPDSLADDDQKTAPASPQTADQDPAPKPASRRSLTPTTPFDYPLVSPIFLLVLAAWFGYDGWFNPATKSVMFNRIVFGFLIVGAMWTLSVDLKIMRIRRERKQAGDALEQEATDE